MLSSSKIRLVAGGLIISAAAACLVFSSVGATPVGTGARGIGSTGARRATSQHTRARALPDSLEDELIGYYTFDNQDLTDSSGHNRTGKPHGRSPLAHVPGVTGSSGSFAVGFDGHNGVDLPRNAFAQQYRLSVALWFNPALTQNQAYAAMVYRAHERVNSVSVQWSDRAYAIFYEQNGLHVVYTTQGATAQTICIDANYGIVPETWNHVVLTIDAPNQVAYVYLNGALIKQCSVNPVGLAQGAVAMRLGATANKQFVVHALKPHPAA